MVNEAPGETSTTPMVGDHVDTEPERSGDLHTAIAHSPLGRKAIGIVALLAFFWIVAPSIPPGPFRSGVEPLWTPGAELGLAQAWTVFSPNPRVDSYDFQARLEFSDGSVETWTVPDLGPFLGAYRSYRWQKWGEQVRQDKNADMWEPTALWLADRNRLNGERPVRVTLVRLEQKLYALGSAPPLQDPWVSEDIYTWEADQ